MKNETPRSPGQEGDPFDLGGDSHGNDQAGEIASFGRDPSSRRLPWVVLALLLVLIGVALFWVLFRKSSRPPAKPVLPETAAQVAATSQAPAVPQPRSFPGTAVSLSDSDEEIRRHAGGLSSDPLVDTCLKEKDIVRRLVAAIDNIARGDSPRALAEFLAPKKPMKVSRKGSAILLDPESYRRYNGLVDFFVSLDLAKCAELYQRFIPLLDAAYAELGHEGGSFRQSFLEAANRILEVPVRQGPIALYEKPLAMGYGYIDNRLESLSDSQKHFLRMGPNNLQRLKHKLQQLMEACELIPKT